MGLPGEARRILPRCRRMQNQEASDLVHLEHLPFRPAEEEYVRTMTLQQCQPIVDKFCGDKEDWLDAVEALGVRGFYWNGNHKAFLGLHHRTNAVVAVFETKAECDKWCEYVNDLFDHSL